MAAQRAAIWSTLKGAPLMDWVPYPVHMGPRFAGPISPSAQKKKRSGCAETLVEAGEAKI